MPHSAFDRLLGIDASVFHYDYHNYQSYSVSADGGLRVLNVNARITGAELALTLQPMQGLLLNAAGTYLHTKQHNVPIGDGTFSDFQMPDAPKWSFTGEIRYGFPIQGDDEAALQLNGVYVAERSISAVDYPDQRIPSYYKLPELGPIGSNGLASPRDFEAPVAAFEDSERPFEIVQKFQGGLWTTTLDHSPFDVVAWHGNLAPFRYDLRRFNTIGTVSYDHPDPSIFTVLTSPSDTAGTANVDFVIFPPRWTVAEDTFRPPWFHRNVMSEFMGLLQGEYDAKAGGFVPGGASLHNGLSSHGPDRESHDRAVAADLKPHKIEDSMAFMFESRTIIAPTRWAMETLLLQQDYDSCWQGFRKARLPAS